MLTTGADTIWAAIWGIFYRKFFWDMIGGTLGPHGLMYVPLHSFETLTRYSPGPNSSLLVSIIVDMPILQVVNIVRPPAFSS